MNSNNINFKDEIKKAFKFKSEDEKDDFRADVIHINIIQSVLDQMKKQNLTKADIAKSLNISKSFITQLFSGNKLLNLKFIAKLERILNCKFHAEFKEKYRLNLSGIEDKFETYTQDSIHYQGNELTCINTNISSKLNDRIAA